MSAVQNATGTLRREMPTYEYVCRDCGHRFEIVQSMLDEPLSMCPECGGNLRKVFTPPAITFRGSGFYATDHGKRAPRDGKGDEKADEKAGEKTAEKVGGKTGGKEQDGSTATASKDRGGTSASTPNKEAAAP
jgi:putative FmdB family regulatory protein